MSNFDSHAEALKLGSMVNDCMDQYGKQLPVEAMEKEQAIVKEVESFWNDNSKLSAVSKEFEQLNKDRTNGMPSVTVLVGDGQILALEFTPRTGSVEGTNIQPELTIDKGDVDKYSHQGIRAVLEDHGNINTTIVVRGAPENRTGSLRR